MKNYYKELENKLEKAAAIKSALNLFDYDLQVNAPKEGDTASSKIVGCLSDEYRNIFVCDDTENLLKGCRKMKNAGLLSSKEKAMLHETARIRSELKPVSDRDYREFTELTASAVNVWSKAKQDNSFEAFEPVLTKLVDYKKRFAKSRAGRHSRTYDVLLGDFEPGMTTDKLDEMFDNIKQAVIPLIKQQSDNNYDSTILKPLNENEQDNLKKFCVYISEYIGFNPMRGVMAESAHPFTLNIHNKDVRITNNFNGENLIDPIFSAIHESGHALYELGIDDSLTLTILGEGTSMGMHEGISRFYENMVGKQEAFWKPVYPKLVSYFPDRLKDVPLEQFLQTIWRVNVCPVRTRADWLTYPVHIIIRYELEKKLISGRLKVHRLPDEWNRLYSKYLGITPENDSEGVLQDIHWSMGEFGYFPSYLIGSAVSAQIYYHLKEVMPYDEYLENGNITPVNQYLKRNIFRYGKALDTDAMLKNMTGEGLNVKYFIRYLKENY